MSEARRSRILIVTRNLPPLVGGMERLNWHMAEELAKIADVRVIGPEGSAELAPAGIRVREAPLRPLWKFLWRARTLAQREAKAWRPDIVLAGSGLTAPLARAAARNCGAKTAVYVHGLDVAVSHPIYRAAWFPAIRRMNRVIANSRATAELCRRIGVDPAHTGIVHPGVDLPSDEPIGHRERTATRRSDSKSSTSREGGRVKDPAFSSSAVGRGGRDESPPRRGAASDSASAVNSDEARATFRQRHKLGDGPLLLSVGRLSSRKGLREFVAQSLPRIVAARPSAMLLIVGDAPSEALHAQAQTPASIQAAADAVGVGHHIRFLGVITDYDILGDIYRASDVHVFPVRNIAGDPEGFGMVAIEAAAHELPTVAFSTGGVVDAVSEGQSGHLVSPDDYAAFADTVVRTLIERDRCRKSCIGFAGQFAWTAFGEQIVAELPIPERDTISTGYRNESA